MSATYQTFFVLCRCLALDHSPSAIAELQKTLEGVVDWKSLVRLANQQLVSPALWYSLLNKGLEHYVPQDAAHFLSYVYERNKDRNLRIKAQAENLILTLREASIEPVLLKGAIHLFKRDFDDVGCRILADLDLLVEKQLLLAAVTSLQQIGYSVEPDYVDIAWYYSFAPLVHVNHPVPVELHIDVGEQRNLLPASDAIEAAVPICDDKMVIKALSPTHQVIHNVFHCQIQNRALLIGNISLRELMHLAAICSRHSGQIDWPYVFRFAQDHKLARALHAHVFLAHRLLDFEIPYHDVSFIRTPLHYRRCLLQLRWPYVMFILRLLGAVTHPFKKYNIDLKYGGGDNFWLLNFNRLKYAISLIAKYRLGILNRIRTNFTAYYS